jgi:hypothetical protein
MWIITAMRSKMTTKLSARYFAPMEYQVKIPYLANHLQYKLPSYAMCALIVYWNDEFEKYFHTATKENNDYSDADQYNENQLGSSLIFLHLNQIPLVDKIYKNGLCNTSAEI